MSERPDTSGAGVVMGADDLAHAQKVREATPTVDAIAESCGASVRTEVNAFGREEKVATVPAKVAFEAMRESWRIDTEREMHTQALRPTETLIDERGKKRKVWNIHAEQVAKGRKLKPAWSLGKPVARGVNGGKMLRADGTEPPSRMHEILESRQAPAGYVH